MAATGGDGLVAGLQARLARLDAAQAPRAFRECFILVAAALAVAIAAAWRARTTER